MLTNADMGKPESGRTFHELDRIVLNKPICVEELERELSAGASGTMVAIWQGGKAYEVEFLRPFACLVTVVPEAIAA